MKIKKFNELFESTENPEDIYNPVPTTKTKEGKILIISDNECNDVELLYPLYRFVEEGYEVTVSSIEGGKITGYNSAFLEDTVSINEINPKDFIALYLPGGKAPAKLKMNKQVIEIVKDFYFSKKPIGAICHGTEILIEAEITKEKNLTAWFDLEDKVNQNYNYINKSVVVDGNIITSRMPGDLPNNLSEFTKKL